MTYCAHTALGEHFTVFILLPPKHAPENCQVLMFASVPAACGFVPVHQARQGEQTVSRSRL